MTATVACWSVRNVLDMHVDGRLTDSRAAKVEAHLAACGSCKKEAAALRPLNIRAQRTAPPHGLAEEILKKLQEGPQPEELALPGFGISAAQGFALVYLALVVGGHTATGIPSQAFTGEPRETLNAPATLGPEADQ